MRLPNAHCFCRSEDAGRSMELANITPLINIIFLLLIFFMLTAQFITPQHQDITLPALEEMPENIAPAAYQIQLYLQADGTLKDDQGKHITALSSLTVPVGSHVALHADANLEAARLLTILQRLKAMNIQEVQMITQSTGHR